MYFALPGSGTFGANPSIEKQKDQALKNWANFKVIAGTGQAVAFGRLGYIGGFTDELISPAGRSSVLMQIADPNFTGLAPRSPVRSKSDKPTNPDSYPRICVSVGMIL
jgi:hypothetical protein